MNFNSRLWGDTGQQNLQVAAIEADTIGSGIKRVPGHMNEHGAAPTRDSGPRIVVDLNDKIVEVVGPVQPVAWLIGRAAVRAVVAAVSRVLAPGICSADAPNRQKSDGADQPVGPPP
jgi:hypothetical protein